MARRMEQPAAREEIGRLRPSSTLEPPDQFTLIPSVPQSAWKALVAEAVGRITAGEFRKVVLARQVEISGNRPFVVSDVLSRLVALYPSCMVFSIEGFIGASPELLIARTGTTISSHPLAGTVARSGDAHADTALVAGLMASGKARREHQVVSRRLANGPRTCVRGAGRAVRAVGNEPAQRVAFGHRDHRSFGRGRARDGPGAGGPSRIPPRPSAATRPRSPCATSRPWRDSTAAATLGQWVGWTPGETGPGPWAFAAPRWTDRTLASSPVTGWWRAPILPTS